MTQSPYTDPRTVSVYNRVAAPLQFGFPARDLVRMLRPLHGARVLDVGTGTGAVALPATTAVGSAGLVVGIDAAIEMLRCARNTAAYRLAVARIPGLPFPDGVFDVVMGGFVVSHFADYARGLAEIVRVCRAGGRVGITSWGDTPNPAAGLWSETAGQYIPSERLDEAFRAHIPWHDWFTRPANVEQSLRDADLDSITVERREYRFTLTTSDYLLMQETSIQGIVLRQASFPEQWNDFRRRVGDLFRRRFGETIAYARDVHFGLGTKRP